MPLDLVCAWGAFHRGAYWKLLKEFEAEQQGVSVALCSARPSLPKELLLAGHDAAAASAFLRQTLNISPPLARFSPPSDCTVYILTKALGF